MVRRRGSPARRQSAECPSRCSAAASLSGLDSRRRARSRNSARPRFPTIGISAEMSDDGHDVGGVDAVQVEEPGQHAHVEQDRLGVADHRRDADGKARPSAGAGQAAVGVRAWRPACGSAGPPSAGRSPRRPSAGPAGSRRRGTGSS